MDENTTNVMDALSSQPELRPLVDLIEQIMSLPEESLNEQSIDMFSGMVRGAFTDTIRENAIQGVLQSFRDAAATRSEVSQQIADLTNGITVLLDNLAPSKEKRTILENVLNIFVEMYQEASDRYLTYDIELPIKLDGGATMPQYAHESDACADLAALNDCVIPAHVIGQKVPTGVHLQLPEGWQARLAPRSSIGAKTPLRLSNSMGIIDTGYTGDVTVLFDNISDSDYTIHAGDRIAQLWVEPIYRFKPRQVDILQTTERNNGGFGSTGK